MDPAVVEFLGRAWDVFITVIFPLVIIVLLFVVIVRLRKGSSPVTDKPDVLVRLIRKDLLYISIIFGILVMFILLLAFTGAEEAFQYFSFASTITSMVLSVIAIIMTIISEQKSDRVQAAIEESIEELQAASNQVREYAEQIDMQRKILDGLVKKTDENLEKTKEVLNRTKKLGRAEDENIDRDFSLRGLDDLDDETVESDWEEIWGNDDWEGYLGDDSDGPGRLI